MQANRLRLSFQGTRVQAYVYEPDGKTEHRALFVSSPLSDYQMWRRVIEPLVNAGCLCVAVDLPGFGANPASADAPQDNDTRAQILWGVLDEVEARRNEGPCKWHLIAHGSGCSAVMNMARLQQDSTLSRVLFSPVLDRFFVSPVHKFLSSEKRAGLMNALYRRYILNKKRFQHLLTRLYGKKPPKARAQLLHKLLTREGTSDCLARQMREGYLLDASAFDVNTPVMLFWGTEDRIFGGQIPPRVLKKLSGAEKHLLKCAHMSPETDFDAVSDYLRGWLLFSEGRVKPVVKSAKGT